MEAQLGFKMPDVASSQFPQEGVHSGEHSKRPQGDGLTTVHFNHIDLLSSIVGGDTSGCVALITN